MEIKARLKNQEALINYARQNSGQMAHWKSDGTLTWKRVFVVETEEHEFVVFSETLPRRIMAWITNLFGGNYYADPIKTRSVTFLTDLPPIVLKTEELWSSIKVGKEKKSMTALEDQPKKGLQEIPSQEIKAVQEIKEEILKIDSLSEKEISKYDAMIQNIKGLQKIIPLKATFLPELEAMRDKLLKSPADLEPFKEKRREVAQKIAVAIDQWEAELKPQFDIEGNPDIIREEGSKQARLDELEQINFPGLIHPKRAKITSSQVKSFLFRYATHIEWQFRELGAFYGPNCLRNPIVTEKLEAIQRDIQTAFKAHVGDFPVPQAILDGSGYLMVRSTGAEDTRQCANAGGNASIAYVERNPQEICEALGEVVASYFGEGSLQNRINAGENPFTEPLSLGAILHELIGEEVGETDPAKIPASMVLFTNEPTYVGTEPFRVMRVSVTWGHGEGVVGAAGIRSDTILLMRSLKHPDRLYILENNQQKPKRLAPVKDPITGKIGLKKVENPKELVDRPSLSPHMLTSLFYYGLKVEKAYGGHPMDMEIVVKEKKIYPVQARPVRRPAAQPTYLDTKKLPKDAEVLQLEAFLPGLAKAVTAHSPEELLINHDLESAQKPFVQGQHKLVIIREEENANSHPVVNFSSMGIPVMYGEDLEELRQFFAKADKDHPIVACVQSGKVARLQAPADCVSPGYAVHPARVALSVAPEMVRPAAKVAQPSKEIKELLTRATAFETHAEAIEQLKAHIPAVPKGLIAQAAPIQRAAHGLQVATKRALSELKAAYRRGGRLLPLLHAKVVERLFTQKQTGGSIGQFSALSIAALEVDLKRMEAYQKQFPFPAVFTEQLLYDAAILTPEHKKQWEGFLIQLENAHLPAGDVEKFKGMLAALNKLDLLPLWMARSFLPGADKEAVAHIKGLLEEYNEQNEKHLKKVHAQLEEITAFRDNLSTFADPATFEKAWIRLQDLIQPFAGNALKMELDASSPLARIATYKVMETLVDLYDKSVKSMKASLAYDDAKKVLLFNQMLFPLLTLLEGWTTQLSAPFLQFSPLDTSKTPLQDYLGKLREQYYKTGNEPLELRPSGGFNVAAAVLGNATTFERALPQTKEDVFTLIHQNLLKSLELLLGQEMKGKLILPQSLQEVVSQIETEHFPPHKEKLPVNIISYTFTPQEAKVHYNYPMSNHSAIFELKYDENGKCAMKVDFLGMPWGDRWPIFKKALEILNRAELIHLEGEPKIDYWGISYQCRFTSKEEANRTLEWLYRFAKFATGNDRSYVDMVFDFIAQKKGDKTALDIALGSLDTPIQFYAELHIQKYKKDLDLIVQFFRKIGDSQSKNSKFDYLKDSGFDWSINELTAHLNPEQMAKFVALIQQLSESKEKTNHKLMASLIEKFGGSVDQRKLLVPYLFHPNVKPDDHYWNRVVKAFLDQGIGLEEAKALLKNESVSSEIKTRLEMQMMIKDLRQCNEENAESLWNQAKGVLSNVNWGDLDREWSELFAQNFQLLVPSNKKDELVKLLLENLFFNSPEFKDYQKLQLTRDATRLIPVTSTATFADLFLNPQWIQAAHDPRWRITSYYIDPKSQWESRVEQLANQNVGRDRALRLQEDPNVSDSAKEYLKACYTS